MIAASHQQHLPLTLAFDPRLPLPHQVHHLQLAAGRPLIPRFFHQEAVKRCPPERQHYFLSPMPLAALPTLRFKLDRELIRYPLPQPLPPLYSPLLGLTVETVAMITMPISRAPRLRLALSPSLLGCRVHLH